MFSVKNGIVEEVKRNNAVDSHLRRSNLLRHRNTNGDRAEEYDISLGSKSLYSRALPPSMTYVFYYQRDHNYKTLKYILTMKTFGLRSGYNFMTFLFLLTYWCGLV